MVKELKFLLFAVSTDADNSIDCDISNDKQSAQFDFARPFELHDDRETLNMMHMYACDETTLNRHLPTPIADFIARRRSDIFGGSISSHGAGSSSSSGRTSERKVEVKEERGRRRRRQGDDDDEEY